MTLQRDGRYLDWIRSLPCLVCGRPAEAHHTGPHGLGKKADDSTAIPLCTEHHTMGRSAYHRIGCAAFESRFGLVVANLVRLLNQRWKERLQRGHDRGVVIPGPGEVA
jgi:hypothetical protein